MKNKRSKQLRKLAEKAFQNKPYANPKDIKKHYKQMKKLYKKAFTEDKDALGQILDLIKEHAK